MKKPTRAALYTALTIILPGLLAAIITDVTNENYAITFFLAACSVVSLCFSPLIFLIYNEDLH